MVVCVVVVGEGEAEVVGLGLAVVVIAAWVVVLGCIVGDVAVVLGAVWAQLMVVTSNTNIRIAVRNIPFFNNISSPLSLLYLIPG